MIECGYLVLRDVKAGDFEALAAEEQGERESNVSHSDNADASLSRFHSVS